MELTIARTASDTPLILGNTEGLYEGDLWHYFKVLLRAPSATNSYHNVRHPLHATWLAYQACHLYKEQGLLNTRQIRNILIATILHDAGHCGNSKIPDAENIKAALATLELCILPKDHPYLTEISSIISASEYPHRSDLEPLSLAQSIMQDVDLAQALHPAWIQQILVGLGSELGKSPEEMLYEQPQFLGNIRFQTEWARRRFPSESIEEKITEVELIIAGLATT